MSRPGEDLGLLEQQVMLACLRLHPNAYGVSIGDEIKSRTNRDSSSGSIYAAIERLETKGYLERRQGEATATRGGRAKIYFTVTAVGQLVLERALSSLDRMRDGIRIGGLATCTA